MYGKIFESIYDGTIAVNWKGMIVFQQLIVLSDSEGVVDMTPPAISRRTNIPLDIIEEGLDFLSKPDKYSRSKIHEGKRIILIDEERDWGWQIVNHKYYRDLASREDKREKDRVRIAEKRAQVVDSIKVSQSVAGCRKESQMSPMQDADANTIKTLVEYLNDKSGKSFKPVESNLKLIRARIGEGHSVDDIKKVIDMKVNEWKGGDMDKYLRPATLFNAEKFNQYIGESPNGKSSFRGKEV